MNVMGDNSRHGFLWKNYESRWGEGMGAVIQHPTDLSIFNTSITKMMH